MVHNESPGYRVHGRVSLHHDHAVGLLEIVNHVVEYRHEILQVQHQTRPTSDTLDETDGVVTRVLLSLSLSAEGQLACSHALVPDTAERWDATRCVATQLLSLSLSLGRVRVSFHVSHKSTASPSPLSPSRPKP
jgi:hypothetical protein